MSLRLSNCFITPTHNHGLRAQSPVPIRSWCCSPGYSWAAGSEAFFENNWRCKPLGSGASSAIRRRTTPATAHCSALILRPRNQSLLASRSPIRPPITASSLSTSFLFLDLTSMTICFEAGMFPLYRPLSPTVYDRKSDALKLAVMETKAHSRPPFRPTFLFRKGC